MLKKTLLGFTSQCICSWDAETNADMQPDSQWETRINTNGCFCCFWAVRLNNWTSWGHSGPLFENVSTSSLYPFVRSQWPLTPQIKSFHPRVRVDICSKCEEIPSRRLWDKNRTDITSPTTAQEFLDPYFHLDQHQQLMRSTPGWDWSSSWAWWKSVG